MASSMNNWLGFSLSQQQQLGEHQQQQQQLEEHQHQQNVGSDYQDVSESRSSIDHHLPSSASSFEAFNQQHLQAEGGGMGLNSFLLGGGGNNNQEPKLENFFGNSPCYNYSNMYEQNSCLLPSSADDHPNPRNNSTVSNGLNVSMIKTWLRNQPTGCNNLGLGSQSTLSLSMMSGCGGSEPLIVTGGGETEGSNLSDNNSNYRPKSESSNDTSIQSSGAIVEAVPVRKSIETFGQRTSIYRGVTRHRWTGRYEAHLWDNSCRREGQTRKGRQGGYDKEEKAARAYDLAALKYWGASTTTNFPVSNYEKEIEDMKPMTRQEYVASLRRKSSGFSRGASIYRGVTRHHQHGRWQARIGRVAGNKDLYLGTFSTQEEAAEAYDIAAIKFRGLNAVTNFEISRYDVKAILDSTTLPIGGTAKRFKDVEQITNRAILPPASDHGITLAAAHHAWPAAIAFHNQQPQAPPGYHYTYQQNDTTTDPSTTHTPTPNYNLHHLQLGNNNFFQQQSAYNLMGFEASPLQGSNSVSDGSGYMLPMATAAGETNEDNMYAGASGNHLYYLSHHQNPGSLVKSGGMFDLECNSWIPTAVPAPLPHATNTLRGWNDT